MPLMPTPEPRPEPLARAKARLAFDVLVHDRVVALHSAAPTGPDAEPDLAEADLLQALAQSFADAVDRENSSRSILRVGVQVEYVDAVVLTGSTGVLVVDADTYEAAPVYAEARAGVTDDGTVIRGRDLDGYLRTGDRQYAERLGLA